MADLKIYSDKISVQLKLHICQVRSVELHSLPDMSRVLVSYGRS
jgi:hypothetical protein